MASIFGNSGGENNREKFVKDLARKRTLEKQAFQLCLGLCKKDPISTQVFASTLSYIQRNHYQDVVDERSSADRCGYPLCSSMIDSDAMAAKREALGKYLIDFTAKKIYDTTNLKKFCSDQCCEASMHVMHQISELPLAARPIPTPIVRDINKEDLLSTTSSPEIASISATAEEHRVSYRFLPIAPKEEVQAKSSVVVDASNTSSKQADVAPGGDTREHDLVRTVQEKMPRTTPVAPSGDTTGTAHKKIEGYQQGCAIPIQHGESPIVSLPAPMAPPVTPSPKNPKREADPWAEFADALALVETEQRARAADKMRQRHAPDEAETGSSLPIGPSDRPTVASHIPTPPKEKRSHKRDSGAINGEALRVALASWHTAATTRVLEEICRETAPETSAVTGESTACGDASQGVHNNAPGSSLHAGTMTMPPIASRNQSAMRRKLFLTQLDKVYARVVLLYFCSANIMSFLRKPIECVILSSRTHAVSTNDFPMHFTQAPCRNGRSGTATGECSTQSTPFHRNFQVFVLSCFARTVRATVAHLVAPSNGFLFRRSASLADSVVWTTSKKRSYSCVYLFSVFVVIATRITTWEGQTVTACVSYSLHVDNITFTRRDWVALSVVLLTALARYDAHVGTVWSGSAVTRGNGNSNVRATAPSPEQRWEARLGLSSVVFNNLVATICGNIGSEAVIDDCNSR
eukprot:m.1138156 g.1138156  ORF g.1138156 m.1138156 type:complete len:692 (+) comp24439_c0_seq5:304-2379(+)